MAATNDPTEITNPTPHGHPEERPYPAQAPLVGRHVALTPVAPEHYKFLYDLATQDEVAYRWRFRGFVPSFEAFVQSLWHEVTSQFVLCSTQDGRPLGHVVAYGTDQRNGHTHMGMALTSEAAGSGVGTEAGALFTNYLFSTWNFVKVYGEIPEFNMPAFQGTVGIGFVEEGRLGRHAYYDGHHWDMVIVAFYREDMAGVRQRLDRLVQGALGDSRKQGGEV